jgi:hypothetical protein
MKVRHDYNNKNLDVNRFDRTLSASWYIHPIELRQKLCTMWIHRRTTDASPPKSERRTHRNQERQRNLRKVGWYLPT